ncbi:hypothetical protein SAMN05444695_11495 [Rhodococcus triatomae]|uniref:DUF4439 domain-containing protein n=1 Tax=Rhodococcus triatomae TaxID=300028 RepID=A0A1G8Q853_9NOCA|nr:hypothetical protein [Rhodococcus triatomae]SDJ00655.1 hypothetical protein SAMN05444695_11495 [Rhodococcus triatomae]
MPGPTAATSPCPPHRISRRSVLRLTAVVALAGAATSALAGCSSGEELPDVDLLVAQAEFARRDAAAATAAIAVAPEAAAALTTVATQRTEHAAALDDEIDRAAGGSGEEPIPGTDGDTGTPPSEAEPATVDEVRALLEQSHRAASDLAVELSGHRAGLLASIAASCHIQRVVLLP